MWKFRLSSPFFIPGLLVSLSCHQLQPSDTTWRDGGDAPRIVSEARTPPSYRPDRAMPEILASRNAPGLGPVDFGAVAIQFLRNAYRGTGMYARDKPRTNLRLIANIQDPSYVLGAARAETGIIDLSQIWEKRRPVDLRNELAKEGDQEHGTIPPGLYRGVDPPIPAPPATTKRRAT